MPSSQPSTSCSIATLDYHTHQDLKIKLEEELQRIMGLYSIYVRCIRKALQARDISAKELSSDLLMMSAIDVTDVEKKCMLLSAHRAELERAVDLFDIFNLLTTECASFLNFNIFQFMVDSYKLDPGQEELSYPEHLKAYINKLKIEEFSKINPLLKSFCDPSNEVSLVLKIDIQSTSRLAKLTDIQTAIAKILNLSSAVLRLVNIEEGCVVVTFLLPAHVAELVFNKHTLFGEEQVKMFQVLKVLSLEGNGCKFEFTAKCQPPQLPDSQAFSRYTIITLGNIIL